MKNVIVLMDNKEDACLGLNDQFFECATSCVKVLEPCLEHAGESKLAIAFCAIRGALCLLPRAQYLNPPSNPS